QLPDFGAIERGVGGAWRADVVVARGWFDARVELRPARGDQLADLPAGQTLAAGEMIKAGLVLGGEFPNRPRRDDRRHRTAIFIREQVQPASGLPGAAHLFVEAAIAGWRRAAVERDADDGVLRVFQDDLFGGN